MVKSTIFLFGLASAYAPIKTGRGDLECPSGYKQITSSEQCRAACKTLGWANDVHGDRTPEDRGQFMYQQGCIENGLYCYYNEYDPATETLSAVGQRSMVCDQIGAVVMTSGGSTPCQDAGLFDVSDPEECASLAKALNLDGANGALNNQDAAHVQNENDRPRGCRVQTFGDAAWINERQNPAGGASSVHQVICKTAYVFTAGGSTPCQDAGLFDVMGPSECVTLALAAGLDDANGALDNQDAAHVQNENNRPRGCRVQTFGPAAWINERANPSNGASEVHQVVCKEAVQDAVVMTSGGSTPCQDAGLYDVMDAAECVTLAKALGLAGANGALDNQNAAHVQNENDRPRGCRVQTFGPAAWINERANPSGEASAVHRVVCKTVCETSTLEDGTAWVSSTGATCEQYAEWEWCTPNGEYGAGWGSSWGTFSDWANEGMSALDACCQCNSGGERRREESSGIALAKAAGSLGRPGRLGRLLAGM